jgi:hypothetical protein
MVDSSVSHFEGSQLMDALEHYPANAAIDQAEAGDRRTHKKSHSYYRYIQL